jgi:5-methylcytosine-specific restriction enzyme subunit McrC
MVEWGETERSVRELLERYVRLRRRGGYGSRTAERCSYCTVLGLPVGHLVYAVGNEDPARHVVRQSGTEIICHALDLSQSPSVLLTSRTTSPASYCG